MSRGFLKLIALCGNARSKPKWESLSTLMVKPLYQLKFQEWHARIYHSALLIILESSDRKRAQPWNGCTEASWKVKPSIPATRVAVSFTPRLGSFRVSGTLTRPVVIALIPQAFLVPSKNSVIHPLYNLTMYAHVLLKQLFRLALFNEFIVELEFHRRNEVPDKWNTLDVQPLGSCVGCTRFRTGFAHPLIQ